ncbi:VTT domain-containing protein [Candidatus Poribacteria bacterium]|nr:VTT domain-containing protein [Candidatus Poribacteria bacterium]
MFSKIGYKWALIYSAVGLSALLAILAVLFPDARLMIAFFIYIATLNSGLIPFPTMTTVIFLGKNYSPFLVAAVGTSGSAVSSIIIYYMVTKVSKKEWLKKIENSSIIGSWKALTCKSPFLSLVVSNALPLPIEPSRFIAVFNRYSITRYVIAISLGRFVRYFLLAVLGETFQISNGVLIVLTVMLIAAPLVVQKFGSRIKKRRHCSEQNSKMMFRTVRP